MSSPASFVSRVRDRLPSQGTAVVRVSAEDGDFTSPRNISYSLEGRLSISCGPVIHEVFLLRVKTRNSLRFSL